MEVPLEFLQVLSSTLSTDHSTRAKAEEQLSFLEKSELRTFFP
jgi:hypothetical protein